MRKISYGQVINETLYQLLDNDENVFLIGQGITSPWYVGNTTVGLIDHFGPERIIDTPISECAITGAAVGAAMAGMRPILMHPRMDFMFYAMDQVINQAANWYYMFGGKACIPLTIWSIINRGGEQAAQHSQSLQAMYAHVPGLKVVMPSTAYDVKGLFIASVFDDNPVIFIDDRWLYDDIRDVPEEMYQVTLGKGKIRREGKDITLVATSYMVPESLKAATNLEKEGIEIEIVDLLSLKPLDDDLILKSVQKTGMLVIADAAWKTAGFGAEIAAIVTEKGFNFLKAPIARVALPDTPAPASSPLEKAFYIDSYDIIQAVKGVLNYQP